MLVGIPITSALCFDASAVDQKGQRSIAPTMWQTYSQRSLTAAKGAEIGGTTQSKPISCNRLCTKPVVCRNCSANSTFKVKEAWIAAPLKYCCRSRLSLGGGTQTISGSNQIDSEPRRFKLSLYEDQFIVLYFLGDQLLIHPSHHLRFMR